MDRWAHPRPAAKDKMFNYLMRYPISLMTSVPFLGNTVVRRLAEISDAAVSTHWPLQERMRLESVWEESRRRENQRFLDGLTGTKILVNLFGNKKLIVDQMKDWLSESANRGFVFVSGSDERDIEYAGKPSVNPGLFLKQTRGLYLKQGWNEESLKVDLRAVLGADPDRNIWLMVNYLEGANAQIAERLLEIVEEVSRG